MDHGKWIADAITTYAVPVSGHSKRLPARNPSDVAPRGLASTWACTAAKALCVMKIGYGEFVGAPSTVGVQRIAEPTGNGRFRSAGTCFQPGRGHDAPLSRFCNTTAVMSSRRPDATTTRLVEPGSRGVTRRTPPRLSPPA